MRRVAFLCAGLSLGLHACGATPMAGSGQHGGLSRTRILEFTEHDPAGGEHGVKPAHAVDIDSRLVITIDGAELKSRVAAQWGGDVRVQQKALDAITVMQEHLRTLDAALPALLDELDQWRDRNVQAARAGQRLTLADIPAGLRDATRTVADPADAVQGWLDANYPEFDERVSVAVRARGDQLGDDDYAVFWRTATAFLAEKQSEMRRALEHAGVFVVFGAWSNANGQRAPLHLPGFDTYAPGERYEVGRWFVPLDPAQAAQWQSAVTLAKQVNASASGAQLRLRSIARQLLAHLEQSFAVELAQLQQLLDDADMAVAGAAADVKAALAAAKAAWREVHDFLQQMKGKYGSDALLADLPAALLSLRADVLAVIAKVQALVDRGGDFVAKLQAISADLTDKIKPVLAALAAAKPALAKLAQVLGITGGTHSLLDAALQFGEEVLRLDLANVPKETELDLRDTGRRAAGDRVLFRMAAGRRSNPDDIQTLEQREITMHRILSHVTSAVGVNFANPAGQSAVQNNFQAGPAYNLMLKLGLRDSRFWNEFLSPGVGINLTALDFDKDDAQELGLGVGVTLFRDWIQAGYGYDLGDDRAYWYFGLSLPLATFAFGERKP